MSPVHQIHETCLQQGWAAVMRLPTVCWRMSCYLRTPASPLKELPGMPMITPPVETGAGVPGAPAPVHSTDPACSLPCPGYSSPATRLSRLPPLPNDGRAPSFGVQRSRKEKSAWRVPVSGHAPRVRGPCSMRRRRRLGMIPLRRGLRPWSRTPPRGWAPS